MKKLVIVLLAVCLLFVAACAPAATPGPAGPGPAPTPDAPAPVPPPAAPVPPPAVTVPTVPEPGAQLAEHIDVTIDSGGLAVINPFMPTGNTGASQWTYTLIYDRLVEELGDGLYG
ncbi:MAG: hypothetical protein FWB75_09965, partial [Oscillospiraceae bacterium]|nr:hypothetical protein [Oscillospiraceae bacterium]